MTEYSAGIDENGNLVDPDSRWGGIMREVFTNDFEAANIEFIEGFNETEAKKLDEKVMYFIKNCTLSNYEGVVEIMRKNHEKNSKFLNEEFQPHDSREYMEKGSHPQNLPPPEYIG